MRLNIATLTLCCAGVAGSTLVPGLRAADAPAIALPSVDGEAAAGKFSTLQLEYVRGWIKQHVPTCPPEVATAVAERFLEDLRQQSPARFEQIPSAEFPIRDYESTLYRHLGAQLSGPANAALREDLARRRVQSMLEKEGAPAATAQREAGELLEKIREISSVFHRRLLEGRTEDDDLSLQLKRARRPEEARTAEREPAEKKALTVTDILSNYARENQQASALQRLRAYTLEGQLRTATGEEGRIVLARMRPDRFRFELTGKDGAQYVLAFDGQRYWQQAPGRPAQVLTREAVGPRRYLGEFVSLLFGEEKAEYERLEDGAVEGKPVYRVAVKRIDGTRYVAHIDPESFRQVGRENEDKTTSVYSDFREIAGVTISFHEQVVDGEGRKGTFEITRMVPNPGLIQAFFEPAKPGRIDYFTVQRALQQAPAPAPEEGRKGQ